MQLLVSSYWVLYRVQLPSWYGQIPKIQRINVVMSWKSAKFWQVTDQNRHLWECVEELCPLSLCWLFKFVKINDKNVIILQLKWKKLGHFKCKVIMWNLKGKKVKFKMQMVKLKIPTTNGYIFKHRLRLHIRSAVVILKGTVIMI